MSKFKLIFFFVLLVSTLWIISSKFEYQYDLTGHLKPKYIAESRLHEFVVQHVSVVTTPDVSVPSYPAISELGNLSYNQKLVYNVTLPILSVSTKCLHKKFITVLIESSPGNSVRRNAIRETWKTLISNDTKGNYNNATGYDLIKIVFLLGQTKDHTINEQITNESKLHDDIVIGQFIENYTNLTLKTIMGLKWAHYSCPSAYILKTDDDVFVNTIELVKWLIDLPRTNMYGGYCNTGSKPIRQTNSKWYVSKEVYKDNEYPPYCLGGGYVMSSDVLQQLVTDLPRLDLFPMEDLHVGLQVHKYKNVSMFDRKDLFQLSYGFKNEPCHIKGIILAHPVSTHYQANLMNLLKQSFTTC